MIWLRKLIDQYRPDYAEARYEALIEKARRDGSISVEDNEELISVKAQLAKRGIVRK